MRIIETPPWAGSRKGQVIRTIKTGKGQFEVNIVRWLHDNQFDLVVEHVEQGFRCNNRNLSDKDVWMTVEAHSAAGMLHETLQVHQMIDFDEHNAFYLATWPDAPDEPVVFIKNEKYVAMAYEGVVEPEGGGTISIHPGKKYPGITN